MHIEAQPSWHFRGNFKFQGPVETSFLRMLPALPLLFRLTGQLPFMNRRRANTY